MEADEEERRMLTFDVYMFSLILSLLRWAILTHERPYEGVPPGEVRPAFLRDAAGSHTFLCHLAGSNG